MTIPAHNPYLFDLPLLITCVSLVYSATRFDDWGSILRETGRWLVRLLSFLGGIALVLYLFTWFG
jgi:hypothetical protein